jgi:3-oxoacyl-[acyl-carrier-protein] synthase III
MNEVFITSTGAFLPGPPIDNDHVEETLGLVNGQKSRLKRRILKSNGIQTRHYAINSEQQTTHQNEEMAVAAAKTCLDGAFIDTHDVGMLSVGTTQGDMVLPGFGSMVQAGLEIPDVELNTSHGICSSSMMAFKAALNSLKLGDHDNALVIGSEHASRLLKKSRYEAATQAICSERIDFDAEFLRWMLSDGAGAVLLQNKPAPRGLSLRVDWMRSFSHADAFPVCMSVGHSGKQGETKRWQDYETYADAEKDGAILIRQDVRLLENIVKLGVDGFLRLIEENIVDANHIDHFLCHYSSHYFRGKIVELLTQGGAMIPEERWYTNLYKRGNTGCASLFIMIDEFLKTQDVKSGDRIFCHVPESGRFNTVYMHLTAVEA